MIVVVVLLAVIAAALFTYTYFDYADASQLTLQGSVALTAALAIVLVIAHNVWDNWRDGKNAPEANKE
jgi:hypothetical protein